MEGGVVLSKELLKDLYSLSISLNKTSYTPTEITDQDGRSLDPDNYDWRPVTAIGITIEIPDDYKEKISKIEEKVRKNARRILSQYNIPKTDMPEIHVEVTLTKNKAQTSLDLYL